MSDSSDDEIKTIDIKNPDSRWSKPVHKGWGIRLIMKNGNVEWEKRFFILTQSGVLWDFETETSKNPCGEPVVVKGKKYRESNVRENCLEIEGSEVAYLFCIDDDDDYYGWGSIFEDVEGEEDDELDLDSGDHLYSMKHSEEIFAFKNENNKEELEKLRQFKNI